MGTTSSAGWSKMTSTEAAEVTAEVLLDAIENVKWGVTVQARSEEYGKRAAVERMLSMARDLLAPDGEPLQSVSAELLGRVEDAGSSL